MPREPDLETDQIARAIIGAAIEVHRHLGPGFLEGVYEAALAAELRARGIPFEQQKTVPLFYKQVPVGLHRLDLLVEKQVIVELKAVDALVPIHFAQMVSYLAATGLTLGLLFNFHVPSLRRGIHRVIRS
ncbi:MAG TPA: GxxExxY protein [Candidatus Dormibacteraeota bacterium]|nr:GxxExxY protein [Candidatus Dormibacteraeota bacterium]